MREHNQAQAFSALFGEGQRICFQAKTDGAPVFREYPFPGLIREQFFCLNPFTGDAAARRGESVVCRQGFTVEMDTCSLGLQREWFAAVLGEPTVANFSGNKSVHNHISFLPALAPEQELRLVSLLKMAFPFSDWQVISDRARLCRTPGAIRDNGREQGIEHVGRRFLPDEVLSALEDATARISGETDTANAFMKALADGKFSDGAEQMLDGKTEGRRKLPGLRAALLDLLECGYPLDPGSFERRALAEFPAVAACLGSEIEAAAAKAETRRRETEEAESAGLKKAKPPGVHDGISGGSWKKATIEAMRGRAREFYEAQGIVRISEKSPGQFRGFTPGPHRNRRGGFCFKDDGRYYDHGSGKGGWFVAFLESAGDDQESAWRTLAGFAGVRAVDLCRHCGAEIHWRDRKPYSDEAGKTAHACLKKKRRREAEALASGEASPEGSEAAEPKRSAEACRILEEMWLSGLVQEGAPKLAGISAEDAFSAALSSPAGCALVEVPTGGGKTHAAARHALECLRRGEPMLYCAAIRRDMRQFAAMLAGMMAGYERDALMPRTAIIASDSEDRATAETILLVTHRTFLSRRGTSTLYYSPLLWLAKTRALCVIDECEEYALSQIQWIPDGARHGSRAFKGSKLVRHETIRKCRARAGAGNCAGCLFAPGVYLRPRRCGVPEILPAVPGRTDPGAETFSPPFRESGTCGTVGTLRVADLTPAAASSEDAGTRCEHPVSEDGKTLEPGGTETLEAMLAEAFQPRCYSGHPVSKSDGSQADPETIAAALAAAKDPAERRTVADRWNYPATACGVRHHCLWDTGALVRALKGARKTILMNAPMPEDSDERAFLEACAARAGKGFEILRAGSPERKLKAVAVFAVLPSLKLDAGRLGTLLGHFEQEEEILWFAESEAGARAAKSALPIDFPAALVSRDGWERADTEAAARDGARVVVSYPGGPFGRAVSRHFARACFTAADTWLPAFALRPGVSVDEDSIAEAQRRRATARNMQAGGRLMRANPRHPDSPKAVVIHGVPEGHIDFARIARNFAELAERIDYCTVAESAGYAWDAIEHWLRHGAMLDKSESEWMAEADAGKRTNEIDRTKRGNPHRKEAREEFKEQSKEKRKESRLSKLEAEVRRLAAERMPWEAIRRKLHLERYPEAKDVLRQVFEDERKRLP